MKKLLIIIFCLFISGCNNYRELNNIAVVSALGIDYKDNMYNVSVLVKDNAKVQVVIIEGSNENKTVVPLLTYKLAIFESTANSFSFLITKNISTTNIDMKVKSKRYFVKKASTLMSNFLSFFDFIFLKKIFSY